MVGNWIHGENLRAFMEMLAGYADATFDEDDWHRLQRDLIAYEDRPDDERRVEWPLGDATVTWRHMPGSAVVSFELEADRELELRAATLGDVMQAYARTDYRRQDTEPPLPPWRALPSFHVGGLTDVGFAEHDGQELLLVVSHNGRGVFDFDGNRVARDDAGMEDTWHDGPALIADGIGPLEGVRVPIVGLWGGGFPLTTRDHWAVALEDEGRVVLTGPDGRSRLIHHETFFDVRAVGFSPSGKALVIATAGECWLFTRS